MPLTHALWIIPPWTWHRLQELMARRAGTTQKDYQATMKRIQANRAKLSGMVAKGARGVDQLTAQIEQVRTGVIITGDCNVGRSSSQPAVALAVGVEETVG